ncbi:deoxyribose-phosphate aldolase [Caproicibacter sp.]|uniref:deoxyribose-phosphate aldolase n=1 Tax=Caproicibacter sp. TaxID=2814884 RepID=UPI00398941D4
MDLQKMLSAVDHTLLTQTATWDEIRVICDDAVKYRTASVCIPASYVKRAKEYLGDKMAVCTVIGFPNGYSTSAVKALEAKDAIQNGADEIDMVINIGWIKDGLYDQELDEIRKLKAVCGERILKVIVETCLLTREEKIRMCEIVTESGADFIKTSTGFSTAGATFEDVALFRGHVGPNIRIKAAGGIKTLDDAERFLSLGASRLGTSRIIKLIKNEEAHGY